MYIFFHIEARYNKKVYNLSRFPRFTIKEVSACLNSEPRSSKFVGSYRLAVKDDSCPPLTRLKPMFVVGGNMSLDDSGQLKPLSRCESRVYGSLGDLGEDECLNLKFSTKI